MSEKILIVDDEPDLELLINQKFRKAIRAGEYDFYFAANGVEALQFIKRDPEISVVFSDINMPEMDGLELLKNINEMRNPLIKPVIISAYGDMGNIRAAMNRGAFDFLTKPVDLNDLEVTLKKTIEAVSVIREGVESHNKLVDYNKELDAAREIQQAILPKSFPPFPKITSLDIFGRMEPAEQVGGDFFDFFMIDDDNLAFVIGDVSGKGVPSAIYMAVARTLLNSFGKSGISTAECLKSTNDILYKESVNSMFVTVFYGIINTKTGEIVYTNAGHNYPFIIKSNGVVEALNRNSSIILGAFEDAKFTSNHAKLEIGDTILLYTDGVTESMDKNMNQLGDTALQKHLQYLQDKTNPKIIVDSVFELVKRHSRENEQSDDITALATTFFGVDK
jgi:sigma-B regulation protein RsbU (phosphoserine phosphatase)